MGENGERTAEDGEQPQPLEGITVVDAASLYAGPLAATYLGDFGAEVIKVEHPEGGDPLRQFGGDGRSWEWVGRNKQSVPLDLKDEDGQAAFLALVEEADVLVESFRPGTLESWGLGWETLSERNPGLVMVRTTGFGQTGPYSDRPGFGTLIEAMSGFAYSTGIDDGPPTLPPVALADSVCALHSAFAAMTALYWRDIGDGTGQYIDSSILESMFALMGDVVARYDADGDLFRRNGNTSRMTVPRNTYRTKDDRWVALSGSTENVARRILQIVGGEEMVEQYPDMATRIEHSEEIDRRIADWMAERTREEVVDIFEDHEAALGPVYNMADIFDDEHFAARDAVIAVERETRPQGASPDDRAESEASREVRMRGVFPKMSETPGSVEHSGPELGAHARVVLRERAGLSDEEIDALVEDGVTALTEE
jgi:crotonobetainyl-CoA:carnitine CoA-transferase CaiB-like acyl-CoA transferase